MLAPLITTSGALSPPIASRAMFRLPVTGYGLSGARAGPQRLGRVRRHDLPAVVVAAGRAHVMRALQLAAIRALDGFGRLQCVVRTPHVATRLRHFLLWNSHILFILDLGPTGHASKRRIPARRAPTGARCLAEIASPGNQIVLKS